LILPRRMFGQLATSKDRSLRDFLAAGQQRSFIDVADPGLALDLDTPEEYRVAVDRLASTEFRRGC
jgi:hypothetical protein